MLFRKGCQADSSIIRNSCKQESCEAATQPLWKELEDSEAALLVGGSQANWKFLGGVNRLNFPEPPKWITR